MGQKIQLKGKDGTLQYPVTSTALVVDAEGRTAEQRLQELAGGISQSAADQRYAKKIIEEFDQPLTLVIADGIVGTDDEYYFIPAKAPSTASDSQILATKADINQGGGEIDTSNLVTKEEFTDVEEVWAASYNKLNQKISDVRQYIYNEAASRRQFDEAIAEIQTIISDNEAVTATSWNILNQKIADVQQYIYDEAASRRQFDEAIAEIQSIIAENEAVVTTAWNQLDTRIAALEAAQRRGE